MSEKDQREVERQTHAALIKLAEKPGSVDLEVMGRLRTRLVVVRELLGMSLTNSDRLHVQRMDQEEAPRRVQVAQPVHLNDLRGTMGGDASVALRTDLP